MIRVRLFWLVLFMENINGILVRVILDVKKRVNSNIVLGLILELDVLI